MDIGCIGGLAATAPAGAAAMTGTVETVVSGGLQKTGVWYSILVVRMHEEDRGVAVSCVRILIADIDRVVFMVHPGGENAGFCGSGVKEHFVCRGALVSETLRAVQEPARTGVGTSATVLTRGGKVPPL